MGRVRTIVRKLHPRLRHTPPIHPFHSHSSSVACPRRARSQSEGSGPSRPGPLWTLFIRQRLRSEHWRLNPSALCDGVRSPRFSQLARNPQGEGPAHPFEEEKKKGEKRVKTEHGHVLPCVRLLVTNGRSTWQMEALELLCDEEYPTRKKQETKMHFFPICGARLRARASSACSLPRQTITDSGKFWTMVWLPEKISNICFTGIYGLTLPTVARSTGWKSIFSQMEKRHILLYLPEGAKAFA